MYISDAAFKSWTQGNLTRVEDLLTEEIETVHSSNPLHHAHALAYRALVRSRSKQWNLVVDDSNKVILRHLSSHVVLTIVRQSIKLQRSAIGHIAIAIARVGNGEHESAMRAFDLVFTNGLGTENNFLLLIKVCVHHPRCYLYRVFVSLRQSSCLNAENTMTPFCAWMTWSI
jgi:hypothetical protein